MAEPSDVSIMALAGPNTKRVDLKGHRVIPGLIDSHMHIIRGGLNYNLELRWDGVRSLADAMRMLKQQVDRTPAPQWVRVIGGFTAHQFADGGGIAVQHRMTYQGEYFVKRYGERQAERTPPIRRMMAAGISVGAGTDATRVASYNPWVSLWWLVSGKTLGGLTLYPTANRIDRETALRMWTEANTWFSTEQRKKGQIAPGQLADFAVLSDDYFAVTEDAIQDITAVMTVLGGKPVYGDGDFNDLAPKLPPPMPDWSPTGFFGGYQKRAERDTATKYAFVAGCGCDSACNVHGHAHAD